MFQPEAWGVADFLLKSKDANLETRLFAAQTFKQKVKKQCHLPANVRLLTFLLIDYI